MKDFVFNSRKILLSQISINDKNEETERLKEYIIMEKEKLEQAKKTFAEDSDKFEKYKKDLFDTTKEVQQEYEKAVLDRNGRVAEIKRIEGDIVAKEMEIKKIEETVQLCKMRKGFLDELAVSAGKKEKWAPGTERPSAQAQKKPSGVTVGGKTTQRSKDQQSDKSGGFFMTSVNTKKGNVDFRPSEDDLDDDDHLQEGSLDHPSVENYVNWAPDEDPDMTIYFTP